MNTTFIFCLNSLLLFAPAFYAGHQCFPRTILRSLLWGVSSIFCWITILELVLGGLGILNELNLFIGSLVICIFTFTYLRFFPLKTIESMREDDREVEILPALNKRGILVFLFIATVLSVPVQSWVIEYGFQIHRIYPLPLTSWDVVTYHLPNALDYLQSGSLWTMQGSFSQYPGGNELINIWSFLPLKNDSMLGINSLALTGIILLGSIQILREIKIFDFALNYAIAGIFIVIGLFFQIDFQRAILAFGQNDLSLACVEILALWALMECQRSPMLIRNWILLGCLLGIGIGIKPNGLYYFIGFLVLMSIDALGGRGGRSRSSNPVNQFRLEILQLFKKIALVSGFAFLLGGFWYIRNLIKLGSLFESSILEAGFPGAIVNNLLNPHLYVLDDTNITVLCIIFINLLGWGVLWRCTKIDRAKFATLLGFNLVSFLSFIITPHSSGFWAGGQWIFKTQLRYALPLIPLSLGLSVIVLKIVISDFFSQHLYPWIQSLHQRKSSQAKIPPLFLVPLLIGICFLQSVTYKPPQGLPGFDSILFAPVDFASRVYQWIQQNVKNQTIYTIALRPYGLYNFPFSNRVIYGGDSEAWSYQSALDILATVQPDYIAIGRNPFNGQFPVALTTLLDDTQRFEVGYGDPLAVVFQVKSGHP